MVRTQIYLSQEERDRLDAIAQAQGISRSDLVRTAVAKYLTGHYDEVAGDVMQRCCGLWSARDDLPDLRRMRDDWTRRP